MGERAFALFNPSVTSRGRHNDDGGGACGDSRRQQYIPITACIAQESTITRSVFSFLTSPLSTVRGQRACGVG